MNEDVRVGVHEFARTKIDEFFNDVQKKVINVFKTHWYVTKADRLSIGNSEYEYILIKAPEALAELLSISIEIIVIFSDYEKFQPRTFDAFDNVKARLELGRVENLCGVLVSRDENVEHSVRDLTSGKEIRTIVPFSYKEIIEKRADSYLFRTKFQKYFYNRDLFAFEDALKTDLFFFGRSDIVMKLINDHIQGKNSGLFGLRKTGKTSILYDVQRRISFKAAAAVIVNCQNPAMSAGKWTDSIFYLVKCIYRHFGMNEGELIRKDYDELSAVDNLLKIIRDIHAREHKTLLVMFDEVEHITYRKAAEEAWRTGLESVKFWKALRSTYLEVDKLFTYCIVGTNPICVEYPTIKGTDNPIFNGVTACYVPGFDVEQTRSMVRKLGRIMGLKFDETLYSKMVEDYGGHPFLVRHLCSFISQKYTDRPLQVDRKKYNYCKEIFNKTQDKYFQMILEVLNDFYRDEYDMLKYLAQGDEDMFNYFANGEPSFVSHLIGYGIVRRVDDYYDFQIDVIKEYVLRKENLQLRPKTTEERWAHLCLNRNDIEIKLRTMVKQTLLKIAFQGKTAEAKEYVLKKLYNDKRKKYAKYNYEELFDPIKSEIYLRSLTVLIKGKWEAFADFMGDISPENFGYLMSVLNAEGRFDAHAKVPDDADIKLVDAAIKKLSEVVERFHQAEG